MLTPSFLEPMPFVQKGLNIEVWLELPLSEVRGHVALHRVSMTEEDGGTALRCNRDEPGLFAAVLLSLGCRIAVRKPPVLREVFAGMSKRAADAAG